MVPVPPEYLPPLFLAWAFSGVLSTVIKHKVVRDRPTRFYEAERQAGRALDVKVHTIRWRPPLQYHGFVSGHTATSVALAMAFTLIGRRRKWSRKWALASWCIALMVSFSRIYIADHWPLDVAAGAFLGILCGLGAFALSSEARADARQDVLPGAGSDADIVKRAVGSA